MRFTTEYLDAVLRKAVEQLDADLTAGGYALPTVEASVEGSAFLFDISLGGQRRFWRYPVEEPVYAFAPDGTDEEAHGLWLATLIEEENTTMLHLPLVESVQPVQVE